ncbi:hypothetical protein RPQ02_40210 [Streptomyces sp. AM2-3-1]|uniref:hypothetical protein n=1 Tax=Streptomyces sp. AM2-3-1 TaxID=3075824 RepID=UPI0028C494B0|nr:hypothetical protein [Streptomyces sp. AM2-3-1]WNO62408.1 hypothetical protein RPQ02_00570 [Streptomyces sp. AM2-3-1]WNO69538.1 hypothetical protein RPQ02_40210 [Streptomyces sp. AM2-3-1]
MADKVAVMRELWLQVLELVMMRRRFAWILLSQNARVLAYDGTTLTLAWINQGSLDNFVNSGSASVLEETLEELLGQPAAVDSVVEKTPPALVRHTPEYPAPQVHVSVAVTTPEPPSQPTEPATTTLHRVLGQTAFLMHEQGDSRAAALLADVEDVELVPGNRFGDWENAVLIVPPYLVPRFTEDVIAAIQPVFDHVAGRHGVEIGGVTAAPALPEIGDGWRQILQEELARGATSNQASRTRAREAVPTLSREGFVFDSREEVLVYEALKRVQAALPQDSTISIFPLPMGRVGVGNAWTPDFLVTIAGRVGIIEVDGPHHQKRFGADTTRDRHWRNSGIVHIERILVEETSADTDLDALVRQFLTRLREYR